MAVPAHNLRARQARLGESASSSTAGWIFGSVISDGVSPSVIPSCVYSPGVMTLWLLAFGLPAHVPRVWRRRCRVSWTWIAAVACVSLTFAHLRSALRRRDRGQSVTAPSPAAETDRPIVVAKVPQHPRDSGDRGGPRLLAHYQFVVGDHPCKLCQLQRVCMIGVTLGAVLNLMLGMRGSGTTRYRSCLPSRGRSHPSGTSDQRLPVSGRAARLRTDCSRITYLHGLSRFWVAIFACAAILMWGAGSETDSGCLGARHPTTPFALLAIGLVV